MNSIIDWLSSNWQFVLLMFGGEAAVLVPLVLGIVKIINKRVNQKANNARITAVATTMRMLHSSLRFLQDSLELLINNVGSETMRIKYSKLKAAAEAVEAEISATLDSFLTMKEEAIKEITTKAEATITALNEVVSVDTNKTVL